VAVQRERKHLIRRPSGRHGIPLLQPGICAAGDQGRPARRQCKCASVRGPTISLSALHQVDSGKSDDCGEE
jgi:hypothetical protein